MATTTWTGTNGNWTDSTWTNGVPNSTLDAVIDGTNGSPDTVTFNTPSGPAHSLSMSSATLAMAGGTRTLANSSSLSALYNGSVTDTTAAGTSTFDLAGHKLSLGHASFTGRSGGTAQFDGSGTLTNTGTIEVTSGTLEITAAFTNTGSIIGAEIQSNGTTFITAAAAALFNQYAAAMESPGGGAALVPPPHLPLAPTLAAPHAG